MVMTVNCPINLPLISISISAAEFFVGVDKVSPALDHRLTFPSAWSCFLVPCQCYFCDCLPVNLLYTNFRCCFLGNPVYDV